MNAANKNEDSFIMLSSIITTKLKKESAHERSVFSIQMKMSTKEESISEEGADAQANYLFERDKVFKEKFDSANRIKRIVPEVSGKKKLRSDVSQQDDVVQKQENTHEEIEVTTTPEEHLSILDYLKTQHSNMSMEEKAACVAFLDNQSSSQNMILVLIFVLVSFVIGMCVGHKILKHA